jgi:hypothetical protein
VGLQGPGECTCDGVTATGAHPEDNSDAAGVSGNPLWPPAALSLSVSAR